MLLALNRLWGSILYVNLYGSNNNNRLYYPFSPHPTYLCITSYLCVLLPQCKKQNSYKVLFSQFYAHNVDPVITHTSSLTHTHTHPHRAGPHHHILICMPPLPPPTHTHTKHLISIISTKFRFWIFSLLCPLGPLYLSAILFSSTLIQIPLSFPPSTSVPSPSLPTSHLTHLFFVLLWFSNIHQEGHFVLVMIWRNYLAVAILIYLQNHQRSHLDHW